MKKSCLVALGALVACIGAANAASLKDTCLANPDKFIWVEAKQDCVPLNPCSQPEDSNYYKLYCDDVLANKFTSRKEAVKEVNWYIKHVLNIPSGCQEIGFYTYNPNRTVDYNNILCMVGDNFVEFKLTPFIDSDWVAEDWHNRQQFRCEALGGESFYLADGDTYDLGCKGLNETQCNKIAKGIESFTWVSRAGRYPQTITFHPISWHEGTVHNGEHCYFLGDY